MFGGDDNDDSGMPGGYDGFGLGVGGDAFGVDASLAPGGGGFAPGDFAGGGGPFSVDMSLSPTNVAYGDVFGLSPFNVNQALSPSTLAHGIPGLSPFTVDQSLNPSTLSYGWGWSDYADLAWQAFKVAMVGPQAVVPGLVSMAVKGAYQGWQDTKDMTPEERSEYYADARAAQEAMTDPLGGASGWDDAALDEMREKAKREKFDIWQSAAGDALKDDENLLKGILSDALNKGNVLEATEAIKEFQQAAEKKVQLEAALQSLSSTPGFSDKVEDARSLALTYIRRGMTPPVAAGTALAKITNMHTQKLQIRQALARAKGGAAQAKETPPA